MSAQMRPRYDDDIIYPDSDGEPMSDNTLQFQWIVTLKENLEVIFAERPDVFVAGDLLWYPVQGRPDIRRAPDAMVAFGRPKGYRGSYIQHREGGIAPQVVFEILSPKNTRKEMAEKLEFYTTYGAEEYYLYDPDHNRLSGWARSGDALRPLGALDGWVSPRLGIRFALGAESLTVYRPDGSPFVTLAEAERARVGAERARAEAERARAEAERRAAELRARLLALGVDPGEL